MPEMHTVVQGEHLAKIADAYGFKDFNAIWNHPNNAALKNKRKTPHVLYPGDEVYIPDRELRVEDKPTDNKHNFVLRQKPLKLRLKLLDVNEQPAPNTRCELIVETTRYSLTSDGSGMIEQEIPWGATTGRLIARNPSVPIDLDVPIQIGYLDPVEEREGQQARLNNLGYRSGEPGSGDEFRFRQAVEEFQRNHHLTVDGVCGPQTQAKLKEVHGC